ncbi:integrase [Maribacter phage Panino]
MQVKGSDYLDYDIAMKKAMELIEKKKDVNFGLLVICGMNMGLRIGDLLTLSYEDLKKGSFMIEEQKTGKKRKVVVNSIVLEAVGKIPETPQKYLGGKCFVSNKGTVYSPQHVNRLLKKYFKDEEGLRISSHSMRKGFGRRYYDKFHEKGGLTDLQLQFNHSTPEVTLRYIGKTQERLDSMYERLI